MYPLRGDVADTMIVSAFDWFASRGMIVRYEVDGRRYFYLPTFKTYQSGTEKEAKSTLPEPPQNSGVAPELLRTSSGATPPQYNADSNTKAVADAEEEPPRLLDIDFGTLCERYSKDIGVITATTSDMLKDDLEKYGLNNCLDAIGECVANNVRRWKYARAILERWKTDGRGNKSKKTAQAPAPAIYTPEPEPPGGWIKPDPERSRKLLAQVEEIARQKREALNGSTS